MSSDYKYAIQLRAEELAEALYGQEYWELPEETRLQLFEQACQDYTDSLMDRADMARKADLEAV